MAVFDLLARGGDGSARRVVLLGLAVLHDFDLDLRTEELKALAEVADVIPGASSAF
jgi:hypothetical protein